LGFVSLFWLDFKMRLRWMPLSFNISEKVTGLYAATELGIRFLFGRRQNSSCLRGNFFSKLVALLTYLVRLLVHGKQLFGVVSS
jgi:hypothetical protein